MHPEVRAYFDEPAPRGAPPKSLTKLWFSSWGLDGLGWSIAGIVGPVTLAEVRGDAAQLVGIGIAIGLLAGPFWFMGNRQRRRMRALFRKGTLAEATILSDEAGRSNKTRKLTVAVERGVSLRRFGLEVVGDERGARGIDDDTELRVLSRDDHAYALLVLGDRYYRAQGE